MDWTTIKSEEDAEYLLSKYYDFHDWYVAGFSYDPLVRSESSSLNLGRFKTDIDTLTVILRDDCKNKNERWPEVELQFDGVWNMAFSGIRDPDPFWGCTIERTERSWIMTGGEGSSLTEEEKQHPDRIRDNIVVVCDQIKWRESFSVERVH